MLEKRKETKDNKQNLEKLEKLDSLVEEFIERYFEADDENILRTLEIEKEIYSNRSLIEETLKNSQYLEKVFSILENLVYVQNFRIWVSNLIQSNLTLLEEEVNTGHGNLFNVYSFLEKISKMVLEDLLEQEIRDEESTRVFYEMQGQLKITIQRLRKQLFSYISRSNENLQVEDLLQKKQIIEYLIEKKNGSRSKIMMEFDLLLTNLAEVVIALMKRNFFGEDNFKDYIFISVSLKLNKAAINYLIFHIMTHLGIVTDEDELTLRYSDLTIFEILKDLIAIQKIEAKRKGIAAALFKKFGIRYFNRYPTELLIKQFDQMEDKNLRYGVFVSGLPDGNKSFENKMELENITSIGKQLGNINFGIRFTEVGSILEMDRILEELNHDYGNENKIEFMFLRAHASVNILALTLSKDDEEDIILGSKTAENLFIKWKTFFAENFKCVLDGCSVGRKKRGRFEIGDNGGFAQWLSTFFNFVMAPSGIQSGILFSTITLENDKIKIEPNYVVWAGEKDKGKGTQTKAKVFINGRAV